MFALWALDCAARAAHADGVPPRCAVRRRTWIVLALLAALIIVHAALFSDGCLRSAPAGGPARGTREVCPRWILPRHGPRIR